MRRYAFILMMFLLFVQPVRSQTDNCYLVVAGREATYDGSVMLAHNEDNGLDNVFTFRRVERLIHDSGEFVRLHAGGRLEQADTTWAYTVWEMPGMYYSHGMVNEHGVAVVSNSCPSREDRPELTDGGIGPMLRWLVVERSRTARDGAKLVGALVERFGYSASGRTLTIADTCEAWQVAMVNGKHWVARRVPDNMVAVLANSYAVHLVDLADTVNFMGSDDLVDYAIGRGWYNPESDREFDFERVYAEQVRLTAPAQRLRQWTGFRRFLPEGYEPRRDGESYPFAVEPAEPVTRQHLFASLRDHYEGSRFEATRCLPHETPCYGSPRTVCCRTTNHGDLIQLRSDVPEDIRVVWWYSFWRPCNSPFIAMYPLAGSLPRQLCFEVAESVFSDPSTAVMPGREKAIGIFRDLSLFLDEHWEQEVGPARMVWSEFERDQFEAVLDLEEKVNEGDRGQMREMLADFNESWLERAMKLAAGMLQ